MSQQINLLDPSLRPRRDWLRFNIVAPAALSCMMLVAVASVLLRTEQRGLQIQEAAGSAQLKATQERVQAIAKSIGQQASDPRLVAESEMIASGINQRLEVLDLLEKGRDPGLRFSEALRGLARQSMDGLWLTAFATGGDNLEIHGRMLDPALLSIYIRHLNAEPAFQGRRFDALDVQEAAPPQPQQVSTGDVNKLEKRLPRYAEFFLRAGAAQEKPGTGGRQ